MSLMVNQYKFVCKRRLMRRLFFAMLQNTTQMKEKVLNN